MKHTTANIANLHKDAILDAVQAARSTLRDATRPEAPDDTRRDAAAAIATLDRVNAIVVADQHDAGLALNLSEVVVALRDLAPTLADGTEMRAAADRLHLAAMLLFVARRERDLDGRLRAILKASHGLLADAEDIASDEPAFPQDHQSMAADIVEAGRTIARLARA